MRKSTFFWRELYRLSPLSVERCACVWMNNGARRCMKERLGDDYDVHISQAALIQADGQTDIPECAGGTDMSQMIDGSGQVVQRIRLLDAPDTISKEECVDQAMASLDMKHQHERRIMLTALLVSGLVLTFQPFLSLNFFSLPLLLAGAMLLGLEFSPRTGEGIIGLVRRFKSNADESRR